MSVTGVTDDGSEARSRAGAYAVQENAATATRSGTPARNAPRADAGHMRLRVLNEASHLMRHLPERNGGADPRTIEISKRLNRPRPSMQ